jgi:hypothetical protein
MDDRGMFIQQDIVELAKIDYDKKRLTEARKLELFNKFIESIKGF